MKILKTASYEKLAQQEIWEVIEQVDGVGQPCDHCGNVRGGAYMNIIKNMASGETKQVGNMCLGFYGIHSDRPLKILVEKIVDAMLERGLTDPSDGIFEVLGNKELPLNYENNLVKQIQLRLDAEGPQNDNHINNSTPPETHTPRGLKDRREDRSLY